MAFIENLSPNPSFEVDLTGYTALTGTTISQSFVTALAGGASMLVECDGTHPTQGFFGPVAQYNSPDLGSVSIGLAGITGVLTVSAVYNPGGNIITSQTVNLTPAWQRIQLNNLVIPNGDFLYFLVETPFAQDIQFYVDAVQYEETSPASKYIDGDAYGCGWLGTPGLSASAQQVMNPLVPRGGMALEGRSQIIDQGEVFSVADAGSMALGGTVALTVTDPVGALDDFGIWELTDLDPAMTYAGWNNANTSTGRTGYNRVWGMFYPPLDYPVSDGSLAWARAAYMALGFEFISVAAGAAQNIANSQVEMSPIAGTTGLDTTPAPAAYDTPRAIHTIVKPTRLNYCPNPSFEVSTANWTAFNSTLTRDTTKAFGVIGEYDGTVFTAGTASGKVSVASGTGGAWVLLSKLIMGDTYTFSAYVQPGAGVDDILVNGSGGQSVSLAGAGDLSPLVWYRVSMQFTASASTLMMFIQGVPASDVVYPFTFNIDAVLCEAGELVGGYFDGDFEDNEYGWETGGTPGLTRSYYYQTLPVGQSVVADILDRHTPLGISAADPQYFVPPTQ